MKIVSLVAQVGLLASTAFSAAILQKVEERQVQPISTVTGPAGTSYIYAFASPIPDNIASQLVVSVPAVPTVATSVPPAVNVSNTPDGEDSAGSYTPGFRNIGYYGSWYIYARQFNPSDLIISQWTHVLVGFWDIKPNGEVFTKDNWSDFDITTLSPEPSKETGALNGVFEQMFRLKTENRNLKVMLSIGGWAATSEGAWGAALATAEQRATFAKSATRAVIDLGLDGIDLDWEYPRNPAETEMHVDSLRLLRQELDSAERILGVKRKLLLSIAAPAGPHFIAKINIPEVNKYVDFFNLMSYDMGGSFSKVATHAAPFFMATDGSTEFCLVDGLEMYLAAGVPASKINVLSPIYGHSFAGTDGPGKPFTGPGFSSWTDPNGVPDYNLIVTGGATEVFDDEKILASWSYNKQTREMISFDIPKIVRLKTEYLMSRGMGGIGFWAINGDKLDASENLVNTAIKVLGGRSAFEQYKNHLLYPDSKYPNIRVPDGIRVPPRKTLIGEVAK
ncbi:hypothetical protein TWF718_001592 [Orbilia javanica]|uniref:chitinase n=1 Tax=Orbilia javanica TaxID=47235 RepID=A0AAN8N1J2_9PEZI